MKDLKPMFFHYRKVKNGQIEPRGGLTCAVAENKDFILVGISKCSKSDHFNKKIGRDKSSGRLYSTMKGCAAAVYFSNGIDTRKELPTCIAFKLEKQYDIEDKKNLVDKISKTILGKNYILYGRYNQNKKKKKKLSEPAPKKGKEKNV